MFLCFTLDFAFMSIFKQNSFEVIFLEFM
jgi:hypothetical protein